MTHWFATFPVESRICYIIFDIEFDATRTEFLHNASCMYDKRNECKLSVVNEVCFLSSSVKGTNNSKGIDQKLDQYIVGMYKES